MSKINKISITLISVIILVFVNLLIALLRPLLSIPSLALFELLLFALQPIFLIWTVIFFIINVKKKGLAAFLPLIILIGGYILWSVEQRMFLGQRLSLQLFQQHRMEVVREAKDNKLPFKFDSSKKYKYVTLPQKLKNSAQSGSIAISKDNNNLMVYFYMYRSFIGQEGFIYSENGEAPKKGEFGWDYVSTKKLGDNWYWVVFN